MGEGGGLVRVYVYAVSWSMICTSLMCCSLNIFT